MPGNFEIESTSNGSWLTVVGKWTDDISELIAAGQVDSVNLNYALGFQEHDLEFLRGLPIRRLKLLARTHSKLDPLYSLAPWLESLDATVAASAKIDLARFPTLTHLSADWPQIEVSVHETPGLVELRIGAYGAATLNPLLSLTKLRILDFSDRPALRSLGGIGTFRELEELGVRGGRNLEDITALATEEKLSQLTALDLEGCNKVSSINPCSRLTSLTTFNIGECGDIESLKPIEQMKELEMFIMWESTNILDGDLSPVLGLPKLRVFAAENRRSYRLSAKEIDRIIESRQSQR